MRYLELVVEKNRPVWGKVELIPVDARTKQVGRPSHGEELAVRYMLGRACLELHRQSGDRDQLVKAALNLRRCNSFNQIRDTNKKLGDIYTLNFQQEIEMYYVAGAQALADTYLLLHEQKDLQMEWPKYVSQVTTNLEPRKEKGEVVLQPVPTDEAGYLWHATLTRLQLWASFMQLSAYQYRTEYRANLQAWLELVIRWVDTYGSSNPPEGVSVQTLAQEAYDTAVTNSAFSAAYLTEGTKQHQAKVGELASKLAASAVRAGVPLKKE